jgi:tripartite-type tricarboxylate transporter receptor subunit TctC
MEGKVIKRMLGLIAAAALLPLPSLAQGFPSKPVNIVVPFSAGGPADIIARLLAVPMSKALNQPVVVENVVGAGGTLGTNRVARAAPDGHTVLLMHTGQATAPALYAKLPFDPVKDFETIGLVTDVAMTLVGRSGFAANNLTELVAYLKANPDKATYGNVGPGSVSHLCGLMFMNATNTKMTIQYKGGAPALNDLIGGHIDVYCEPATGTTPHIQSGRIKAYAVTTKTRVPTLPNVPTSAEAGAPGFDVTTWYGMYAPRGTPKAVVDSWSPPCKTR